MANLEGTASIRLAFSYEKIELRVTNPSGENQRHVTTYDYDTASPSTEAAKEKALKCWFVSKMKEISHVIPYLQFTDFSVTINGVENIVTDLETVVNSKSLKYYCKIARNQPGNDNNWVLWGPLKYIVANIYKKSYKEILCQHKKRSSHILKQLEKINTAMEQSKQSLTS
jgi:hypothetical protein